MTDDALLAALATALTTRGWMLATGESCTGGLLAAACTTRAGSSDWFERGVVSYSNAAKTELLGVPAALITRHGAVSAEVACAMPRGLLARAPVQLAVSVTGIAGPGGGTPGQAGRHGLDGAGPTRRPDRAAAAAAAGRPCGDPRRRRCSAALRALLDAVQGA
jgi:PncC family amidohydrolase